MRADELNVQFLVSEPAARAMEAWRGSPPEAFASFELVDESYNSLTYERRFMEWPMKITHVLSFGIFGRMGESIWRATVRFDADGDYRTKVTIVGLLDEETRAVLGRWAAEHGQIVQDWGLPTGP